MLKLALFVDEATLDADRLLVGLSTTERERYARQRSNKRGRQYLASRWLVRRHLAAELAVSPSDIEIVYPAGRPPYARNTPLRIGLSHSGPACLSLLSPHRQAGCDIEHVRSRHLEPEQLAQRHFAPDEARALDNAPADRRLGDFYRLWTLKEAEFKALGPGPSSSLASPAFALRPRLRCLNSGPDDPGFFATLDLDLPAGRFALAIATRQPPAAIVLERFEYAANGDCRRTAIPQRWQTTED